MAVVRKSTAAALELFAADDARADHGALAPLPESLTEQEREDVARGCYEMLMVLAEAVAQPLPGESRIAQAREALQILDRAARLLRQPTHAYHLRRAACLERAGDAEGAQRGTIGGRAYPAGWGIRPLPDRSRAIQTRLHDASQATFRPGPAKPSRTISGPSACWPSAT